MESVAQAGYGKPSVVILNVKVLVKPIILVFQKSLYSGSEFKNQALGVFSEYWYKRVHTYYYILNSEQNEPNLILSKKYM